MIRKKLFSMFMALTLAAIPAAVYAEAAEESDSEEYAVKMHWEDEEDAVADIPADYIEFEEIGVKLWIPDFLEAVELTDQEKEAGFIACYTNEDDTAKVDIHYADPDEEDEDDTGLDVYESIMEGNEEISNLQNYLVNGIDCLSYDMEDSDTSVLAFEAENGRIVEIMFSPMSDDSFLDTSLTIMCSLNWK